MCIRGSFVGKAKVLGHFHTILVGLDRYKAAAMAEGTLVHIETLIGAHSAVADKADPSEAVNCAAA